MALGRLDGRGTHGAVIVLVALAVAGWWGITAIAAGKDDPVPGAANVWVDTDGGSCLRSATPRPYVSAQACRDLASAANTAAQGDLVLVRDGTYGGATLTAKKRITIQGAGPGRPSFGQVVVSGSNHALRHLLVENRDDQPARECGYALLDFTLFVCGPSTTFDDVIVDGLRHGSGDPARKGGLQVMDTATGLVFANGEIRGVSDSKGFQGGANGMLIANTTFRDIRLTPAGGAAGVHNECAYVTGGSNQTWRGNRFLLCPVMAMFFPNYSGGPPFSGVVVEHNVFTHTLNETGAWHGSATFVVPNGPDGQNQVNDWIIRYNTFEVPPRISSTPSTADDNGSARFYGNIGADGDCGIPEWTYSYNVGDTCGGKGEVRVRPAVNTSSDPNQAPFYVDASKLDFRLRPGSAAIDRGDPTAFPATDADGYNRPIGAKPDAGAYEYGTGVLVAGELGAGDARRQASRAIQAFQRGDGASLLVSLGNTDAAGGRRFSASWRSSFGWLNGARIGVAGALGPGDVSAGRRRYVSTLGMPAPYYVRRLRDIEVVVLDSTRVTPAQTSWLQRTLAAKSSSFRMVVLHQPPYSCAGDEAEGDDAVRKEWVPLFQRHGVRLVIAGHAPGYQRFRSGRLTYVAATAGSEQKLPFPRCPRGFPRRLAAKPGPAFVYVTAGAGRALVRAVGLDGRTIDRFRVG